MIALLCLAACSDEEYQTNEVKEGVPVSVNFQFKTSILDEVTTRGLTEAGEFQINDLYLFIFDSERKLKTGKYYSTDDLATLNHQNGDQSNPTHGMLTDIKTTSGTSYIYGIANVEGNELDKSKNLKDQLDKVSTVEELKEVVSTLNNEGNIARTVASLLMSGTFQASNTTEENKKEGKCVIPATNNATVGGTLYLKRLDSYIKFDIKLGESITGFELKSWQVYNVPNNSYLIAQDKQYAKATYANSELQTTYIHNDNTYSFDFYMQENLKEAITASDGTVLTSYKDREKEYKNEDGTNTGNYKYVKKYATFVELKAKMNIETTNEEGTKINRFADVRYIIHLGGGESDYTNFNSLRNQKYTYTVTINDAKNIIVEVTKSEDDNEARPGAEGDVIDTEGQIIELDAHYNCFNIEIKKEHLQEGKFSFMIQSPFAPNAIYCNNGTGIGSLQNTDREAGDYKWVRLRKTDNKTTLAKYRTTKDGDLPMTLYEFAKGIEEGTVTAGWYTVFIDEYYYDEAPTEAAKSSWKKPIWRNFVNKEDRRVLLFLNPKYSTDKESSYSKATYVISQKSIQTYYSTETFYDTQTALGIEHVNETGAPNWKEPGDTFNSTDNGFTNTWNFIGNKKWDDYVNYSISESYPYTYNMKDIAALAECLSRNRDENGDESISQDELKWYLPARDQLVAVFLGAKSLPTPLFDDKSITSVTYNDGNNHYITSNKQKIWAEEGCSFGDLNSKFGDAKYPKNLRCVRNLGIKSGDAINTTPDKAYKYYENNRVFAMKQLTSPNRRPGKISAELALHDNFDDMNRPYVAFQMAKSVMYGQKDKTTWADLFTIDSSNNSYCKKYKDNGKKWRAPNQREFMIMFLQDPNFLKDGDYRAFSRTHWKYDKTPTIKGTDRHFGLNGNLLFLDCDNGASTKYNRIIRCVRDVDIDEKGNIINDN